MAAAVEYQGQAQHQDHKHRRQTVSLYCQLHEL